MRAGESLVPMLPDMLKRIFDEAGPDFTAEICRGASLIAEFSGMQYSSHTDSGLDSGQAGMTAGEGDGLAGIRHFMLDTTLDSGTCLELRRGGGLESEPSAKFAGLKCVYHAPSGYFSLVNPYLIVLYPCFFTAKVEL
ncbi:MAG: hypothetical protein HQK89_11680 [Nitrospirae bacterium]|nr:hypothetical protein [Nitrospirota bacterium]